MSAPTDWRAVAEARRLGIPDADLDLVLRRQEALEEIFRPLTRALTPDQEPAAAFRADVEAE